MYNATTSNISKPQFTVYPKRKSLADAEAMLYMRISFQFTVIDKSLGIKIPFQLWDKQNRRVTGNPYLQKQTEDVFNEYKEKMMGAFYLLSQNTAEPTLREIMDLAFAENDKKGYSLISVFTGFVLKMERQQNQQRQQSNVLKHATCLNHLKGFLKSSLNVSDISFNRINRNFIDDFEVYLKTECSNGHNSAMKLMQIFKRIYTIALNNRWTSHNAFAGKKLTYKEVDIEVLNEKEIQDLKILPVQKSYLEKTRQLFLFCIHSGLAYTDLQHLQRRHIEFNPVSGQYVIRKKRQKTGVEFILPLFEPARQLLQLWDTGWEKATPEKLLAPSISNQKFNVYLKELFAFLNIQKKITTHVGRHTFATTLALENGVPIESVSKMLGHTKISQTQRYAKVTVLKIERETRGLYSLLKNQCNEHTTEQNY